LDRKIVILGTICFLVFLGACAPYGDLEIAVEERTRGMDYLEINKDVYLTERMGPVRFTHDRHFEDYDIACEECHHVYVDGKNVWSPDDAVDQCESCHHPAAPSDSVYTLEIAFHRNCIDCHQALREGDRLPAPAPVLCLGCHENDRR
jgi:hypothetical protein